jgi:hypothetical protein
MNEGSETVDDDIRQEILAVFKAYAGISNTYWTEQDWKPDALEDPLNARFVPEPLRVVKRSRRESELLLRMATYSPPENAMEPLRSPEPYTPRSEVKSMAYSGTSTQLETLRESAEEEDATAPHSTPRTSIISNVSQRTTISSLNKPLPALHTPLPRAPRPASTYSASIYSRATDGHSYDHLPQEADGISLASRSIMIGYAAPSVPSAPSDHSLRPPSLPPPTPHPETTAFDPESQYAETAPPSPKYAPSIPESSYSLDRRLRRSDSISGGSINTNKLYFDKRPGFRRRFAHVAEKLKPDIGTKAEKHTQEVMAALEEYGITGSTSQWRKKEKGKPSPLIPIGAPNSPSMVPESSSGRVAPKRSPGMLKKASRFFAGRKSPKENVSPAAPEQVPDKARQFLGFADSGRKKTAYDHWMERGRGGEDDENAD